MAQTAGPRLSKLQVDEYRREGFIEFDEPVFAPLEFEALKEHFEAELLALAPDVRPEAMDCPHFTDTTLFRWLLSDDVLDLVEPILGPNISLFASHFICKPKGNGKRVPWHEDSFYWRSTIFPVDVVTVWLAIDPSSNKNGAMQVIPKSLCGNSEHERVDPRENALEWEVRRKAFDESQAHTIELERNHASLHDARLLHGSPPNTSEMRRCGYTMRYMSTSVKLSDECRATHNIYLARGRDLAGNRYGDPSKAYEEMARFRKKRGNGH